MRTGAAPAGPSGPASGNAQGTNGFSGVKSVLNTLAVFAVAASLGIGTIFGSLIALCWFEARMLGQPGRGRPRRTAAVDAVPAQRSCTFPARSLPRRQVTVVVSPIAGAHPVAPDAVIHSTRKSAKSNPGETTQVTSDSTVAEATARCQVPAGTST